MFENEIKVASSETLLVWLSNAKTTAARALGHGKGKRNDDLVKAYVNELKARNEVVPSSDELYKTGVFNGEGST